jgi:ubiquinone/menaquinone biosynthesis C-methylase UbiE
MSTSGTPRPDYGLDAPPIILIQALVTAAGFGLAGVLYALGAPHPGGIPLAEIGAIFGIIGLLNVIGMIWYSKAGKLRLREKLLDKVSWRGDETVLDVGCGRGLLLIGAARRLNSGKAVGVDIWRSADLSGNRPEATLENARREGVADRVEVKDGDARQLPFPDASFDVVVSGLALHNISASADRDQAVREIARVLKPGGQVVMMDIMRTADYVRVLRECGLSDARRTVAGVVFTGFFAALTFGSVQFYWVTGRKPIVKIGANSANTAS